MPENKETNAFFFKVTVRKDKNNNDYYGFKFGPLYISVRYNPNKDNWYALGKILPPRDDNKPKSEPFNTPRVQGDNPW